MTVDDFCPRADEWLRQPCLLLRDHDGECVPNLEGWPAHLKVDQAAIRAARAARDTFERQIRWQFRVSERHVDASLDDVQQPPAILAALRRWAGEPVGSLILFGPVGTGKSYAAAAVLRDRHFAGDEVRWLPVPQWLASLRRGGTPLPPNGAAPERADVLVLDDIGLGYEEPSAFVEETLFVLLDERWRAQRPMIVTSNLDLKQLARSIGSRNADRLRDDSVAIRLTGVSRRRSRTAA